MRAARAHRVSWIRVGPVIGGDGLGVRNRVGWGVCNGEPGRRVECQDAFK